MNRYAFGRLGTLLLLIVLVAQSGWTADQDINVAVVEFEEKNSVGLENAGRIIAEWTVTEMKKIGKFQIQERLLMNKVLEEQNLMLSGVIDSSQVVQIGQLYGVEAIVTGSVMRVGDQISVTGRILNVENGEVLKTGSVKTGSLADLETEIIVLANALCDISRTQWEVKTDIARRRIAKLDVGAGIGYVFDNVDWSGAALQAMVRYRDFWGQVWIDGIPVGGIRNIEFGAAVNVTPFIGIAAAYGIVYDHLVDYAESTYVTAGVIASPRTDIELGILLGGALTGTIWTETDNEIDGLSSYWNIPSNYSVWFSYQIKENLLLIVKYTGTEIAGFKDDLPVGYSHPFSDYDFSTGRFSIGGLYSFAIE